MGARARPSPKTVCLEDLRGDALALEQDLQTAEEAEEEARADGAERRPLTEYHRCERDETTSGHHAVGIEVQFSDGKVGAARAASAFALDDAAPAMHAKGVAFAALRLAAGPHARLVDPHGVADERRDEARRRLIRAILRRLRRRREPAMKVVRVQTAGLTTLV